MTDHSFDYDKLAEAVARRVEEKKQKAHEGNGADTGPDRDLLEMNNKYAVVRVGGKTRVVTFEKSPAYPTCSIPVFSTIRDFCSFQDKYQKGVDAKNVGRGTWWIRHPGRRQYESIVYAPNQKIPERLNLWEGFACQPKKGACGLYLSHLREIVCAGNTEHCEYLLSFMAHNVQHPDLPGEVAVVTRGKEGSGKGILIRLLGSLFGSHFRHIAHARHLIGNFNAHLQNCSCLYADEAFFAGDKAHESVLKNLITEETITIEPKGVDPYEVRNCIHLYMSSNSDWVVPASAEARRFFVLDVSDARMQDHEYFGQIRREMDNGGREALLDLLLSRDISNFNIRDVPKTAALDDQKRFSRRGVDRLIEIIAHDGDLPCGHTSYADVAITSGEGVGKGFYAEAKKMAPDLHHSSSAVIVNTLKKDWGCMRWRSGAQRGD